ncbi:peptidoglycan-binding protein LysM [Aquincola sp. S2]|uniref:Peptidoglycan-binding protein LysM n=1 Tax=Pseudaquabacterium terrae TaxID=2732868 RepID=A0ABX2E985_9BURK|nr:peptidoglycan-binding protein LysM [Aquabacterium terrae]NRF65496.1 peptidoglycan-binding protein LysM [Aquabacterium terrae]
MSLFKFLRNAGEKLFGGKEAQAAPAAEAAPSGGGMSANAARSIAEYIRLQKLQVKDLQVSFDGPSGTVEVRGEVPDQATREKVVLSCGNIDGVELVRDELTVAQETATAPTEPPSRLYTVNAGDTLSKIAKQMYGDANAYMKIFEANKPMLKDPDKIYPGQVLRVPAA